MIVDRLGSHFIFVAHWDHIYRHYNYINYKTKELTNKEYLEHWGKWIVWGTRECLDDLAKKLDPFIESKTIPFAKYDRAPIPELDLGACVMCIYCDERQREEVWKILSSIGVEDRAWVFERETVERWLPGGYLLEKWIQSKGLNPEKAEKVRENSRDKFKKMFENEHAIFRGIDQ
jgi:hypothetical protein